MSRFLGIARSELGTERVVLLPQLDWEQLSARDAILVIHPEERLQFAEASAFLSAGGRMAIVDDFGKADQLLERFHIQRRRAPAAPKEFVHDNPALQVARPHITEGAEGVSLRHPIVRNCEQVVTNHPTALHTDANVDLTPVLTLAAATGETSLFALIGVIGDAVACGLASGTPKDERARCGRLFAMADPSVFINLMLEFEDNRDLAVGLLEYLLEDDSWGPRQGKLYVLVNDFEQTGHFGGDTELRRKLETALDDSQQLLDRLRTDGLPTRLAWFLAALAVVTASAWAFRSSGRLYQRPRARYASPLPLVSQGGAPGRAAVLSAPTTHPSLIVLELKSATEEFCRQALGLQPHASSGEILGAISKQGALSSTSARTLQTVFKQMAAAESALTGAQSQRTTAKSVKDMHSLLQPILSELTPNYGDRV